MGRPSRETVMTALYSALVSALQTSFTANTTATSAVLGSPSSMAGLAVGLPVVGGSIPAGAIITSLSPLTLSSPATANGTAVPLICGVQTTGRRVIPWDQVQAQPAFFLRDNDEELQYVNTILQQQTIRAEVWLYSNAGQNPDLAPVTALNNLLDAAQAAMAPDDPMQQRYTIGGTVFWCRMVGKVDKSPGDLDGQAIAVADVEILVP